MGKRGRKGSGFVRASGAPGTSMAAQFREGRAALRRAERMKARERPPEELIDHTGKDGEEPALTPDSKEP